MTGERTGGQGRAWAALAVSVILTACGGGSDDATREDAGAPTSSVAGGDGGATATTDGAGAGGAASGAGGGATGATPGGGTGGEPEGASGGSGSGTTTAPKVEAPTTVKLATACVRPGAPQTITVETVPGVPVGYTAQYADGKTAMDPGYYGGNHAGPSDEQGRYVSTWQVAPTAPSGPVKVTVLVNHPSYKPTRREATFGVSNTAGKCT